MNAFLSRRALLKHGCAAVAAPWFMQGVGAEAHRFDPKVQAWRSFEVTTTVHVADRQGTTRLWLPVPDIDTDYQRSLGSNWSGNAGAVRLVADAPRDVRMLYAEFPATVKDPVLTLTNRVQTRNRAVDWSDRSAVREDPAVLRRSLLPTEWIPTDGIVRKTSMEITRGASGDVDKVRAIYDWLVANAYREPSVRGCGTGDVATMLETGNLGGKCADLNAIFVGLNRAAGIPARDVYGVRLAPSAFGYRQLGSNSSNLTGAQHCRAEVFLHQHGWVAMDPADVLKVMRQETREWIKDPADPLVAPVMKGLFGGWEGNWLAYNRAHDVMLPGSAGKASLPFLMYPQGENASGRFDELSPESFRYTIAAREIST
jgi:transglutaminase-like putative cysteine protease